MAKKIRKVSVESEAPYVGMSEEETKRPIQGVHNASEINTSSINSSPEAVSKGIETIKIADRGRGRRQRKSS